MKVLHLASFVGNIGDNASHMGFHRILKLFLKNVDITTLEIRKFYKNYKLQDKMMFDMDFINYANKFDLLLIGGGGFLDYWVHDSQTATTIDINPNSIEKIIVPTVIASVGCMPHQDVPADNIAKFRNFLDKILQNNRIKIAIRNDGSVNSFKNEVGIKYLNSIDEVLDNAFFYNVPDVKHVFENRKYIAINITNDQIRMKSSFRGEVDCETYYDELKKIVNHIIFEEGFDVVFVPHIYKDYVAICDLLHGLDDFVIRKHIAVAPCVQYNDGANYLFSVYKNSKLVLGSRFHANVCSLAMSKATIGLTVLDRVKYLYGSLGLEENSILINNNFSKSAIDKVHYLLGNIINIESSIANSVSVKKNETLETYKKILTKLNLL